MEIPVAESDPRAAAVHRAVTAQQGSWVAQWHRRATLGLATVLVLERNGVVLMAPEEAVALLRARKAADVAEALQVPLAAGSVWVVELLARGAYLYDAAVDAG